jgi:hypothetical protein
VPAFDNSTMMALGAALLLGMTLLRMSRRRRPSAPEPTLAERSATIVRSSSLADESEARMHRTFRELNARLETKIHILNELIVEADRRLVQLREQTSTIRLHETPPAETPPMVEAEDAPAETSPGDESALPIEEIYSLSDRGLSAAEIAEKLDQSTGEIQLVLGLRRRRKSG